VRPSVDGLLDIFRKSSLIFGDSLFKEAQKHNFQNMNVGGIAFDNHTARKEIVMLLNEKF
jgi:hypothetical protein